MRFFIGVDEAGRGPLAGPVAVGCVMAPARFDVAREFPGVSDSKKLSAKKREQIFELLQKRAQAGDVLFCVRFASGARIDEVGITRAVRAAVAVGVRSLASRGESSRHNSKVLLDGLLSAPQEYAQETIIRGDESVPIISLASIAAKVKRDRLMEQMAMWFPEYGFEKHKGYGTLAHRAAIAEHGLSAIHRATFCKKFEGVE